MKERGTYSARSAFPVEPQLGPLPDCPAEHPQWGRCAATGGHDGRHINVQRSWPQTHQQCKDRWHATGMSTAVAPGVLLARCPGCGATRI